MSKDVGFRAAPLSREESGTSVRLIEHGYEDTPAGLQDLLNRVSGWAAVLTQIRSYLEHGERY